MEIEKLKELIRNTETKILKDIQVIENFKVSVEGISLDYVTPIGSPEHTVAVKLTVKI